MPFPERTGGSPSASCRAHVMRLHVKTSARTSIACGWCIRHCSNLSHAAYPWDDLELGIGQPSRYRPAVDSEVQVQHGSDGVHLPVRIAARVKLVGDVLFEFETAVEWNCRAADPLRPAPRIKPAVVIQLAPDVGIHPPATDRDLLLARQPAAEPPRVLAVDEPEIDAAS